jgi:hypothetical protein
LGIDQIKFQSLFEGESDGQNGAKFRHGWSAEVGTPQLSDFLFVMASKHSWWASKGADPSPQLKQTNSKVLGTEDL